MRAIYYNLQRSRTLSIEIRAFANTKVQINEARAIVNWNAMCTPYNLTLGNMIIGAEPELKSVGLAWLS